MAWQLNLTRKDIRRQEIYFKLHNFLISETESGRVMICTLHLVHKKFDSLNKRCLVML